MTRPQPSPVNRESTFWNGEPCVARRVVVRVGHCDSPEWWCAGLEGQEHEAVEVTYTGQVFFLDDERHEAEMPDLSDLGAILDLKSMADLPTIKRTYEAGWGWRKVTGGHGSPQYGHASLPNDSVVLREREDSDG